MDEPRELQPGGTTRPPVVAAGVRLPPVWEAYGRYARHATQCWACRDVDQRCELGERLRRDWLDLADRAFDQLKA
ncbi:hypothetical protein TU94_28550 [Streptomyces cyaneogriseus subsp. noncyanogenus]|uniref:Uncharacterized protein n=1 Tax=Streptomyces cyaneogriseus subsp. noncyanogenus TaxID=477245 RepID=A0A0C5G477_9ACTN|nr:hypothetical protein [Streptomyces cyaneogriseus]AJP04808.1 hypothetical protein TU94_28550 [Streptomyces cyaneogriseus subsp. noncyanogenus]